MLQVRLFAACADEAGFREKFVSPQPDPAHLAASMPELAFLKDRPHLRVAVNHAWAGWDTPLKDGDEVAFLPPVSGG